MFEDRIRHWYSDRAGCGPNALAILADKPPSSLALGNHSLLDDAEMVSWLKARGFDVHRITLCDLSQDECIDFNVSPDHVLLVSQLMCRNECSWAVVHKNQWIHNFERTQLAPLSFLNHPLRSAYVIYHKDWRVVDL